MRIVVAALVAAFALTACGDGGGVDPNAPRTTDYLRVEKIYVDGKEVTCVIYKAPSKGGVDCDIENMLVSP